MILRKEVKKNVKNATTIFTNTTDYEKAEALVLVLIDNCTGGNPPEEDFISLRKHFVSTPLLKTLLPSWFPSKRSQNQFWQYIKAKFPTYAERRSFLWKEFEPLLKFLEGELIPLQK
jgi:hypothetical protein